MFKTNQINSKHYATVFILFAAVLFLYHVLVYNFLSSKVIAVQEPMYVGDLVRLSYQVDSIDLKKAENTLPKQHLEGSQYNGQEIDVLTIGDSFSNGGGSGKNAFYQDYIASINDYNVLNIRALHAAGGDVPNTLLALYNSGILDSIKPKKIILSIGSRAFIRRIGKDLDWEQNASTSKIWAEIKEMKPRDLAAHQLKDVSIVNTANFKLPFYSIGYTFVPCLKSVCKFPLKEALFSVKADTEILIYKQTLKDLYMNTADNIAKANTNLNRIAGLLKKKGIELYFMPAVSKYDLYYDYIEGNPYAKDALFELYEPLDKAYQMINTKSILLPLLQKGEKDVFYADDTHWSSKASKEIFTHTSL